MKILLILFLFTNTTNYSFDNFEAAKKAIGLHDSTKIMITHMHSYANLEGTLMQTNEGTFVIFLIKGMDQKKAYKTIIHEMCHAKQIQDGKLKYISKYHIEWYGVSSEHNYKLVTKLCEGEADAMTKKTLKLLKTNK